MKPARNLTLVQPQSSTEALLREAFRAQDEARRVATQADAVVSGLVRQLAKERRMAFIRVEAARREVMG